MSSVSLYEASFRSARGYIDGFIMANGTDADHDINFGAGLAADAGDSTELYSSGTLVKQIDATWAAGTNQGGLFTGTVTNSTWYHCFIIKNPTTGAVDCGFDTSVTAANIPATYTKYRRVGSVLTDGSANILAFKQRRDYFWWNAPSYDVDTTTLSTSSVSYTISVPTGITVLVVAHVMMAHGTANTSAYVRNPDISDQAANPGASPGITVRNWTISGIAPMHVVLETNTSAQLAAVSTASSTTFRIVTLGWRDPRGKDA